MLDELPEVDRGPRTLSIIELGLRLNARNSQQRRRHSLKNFVIRTGSAAIHNRYAEISKSGKVHSRPGSERVESVVIDIAKLAADLNRMPPMDPGQVVGEIPGTCAPR